MEQQEITIRITEKGEILFSASGELTRPFHTLLNTIHTALAQLDSDIATFQTDVKTGKLRFRYNILNCCGASVDNGHYPDCVNHPHKCS